MATTVVEHERGERLENALADLLSIDPFVAYSNFAPIAERDGALARLHYNRWHGADLGALVARGAGSAPIASVFMERRAFESEHFDVSMARIGAPLALANAAARKAALDEIYREALSALAGEGVEHVVAYASASDRAALWSLQEAGGFYVGSKISWMASLTGEPNDHVLAKNLRIEVYEGDEVRSVARRDWQRLADFAAGGFDRGPLVMDPALSRERALAVYGAWTEKALTGEWADALLLVVDGREIVAYHTMMALDDLGEAAGVPVLGRGIGGTLPGYSGLFTALQKETIARRPLGGGYLENETQAANVKSISAFGRLGHPCLRSTAAFRFSLTPR